MQVRPAVSFEWSDPGFGGAGRLGSWCAALSRFYMWSREAWWGWETPWVFAFELPGQHPWKVEIINCHTFFDSQSMNEMKLWNRDEKSCWFTSSRLWERCGLAGYLWSSDANRRSMRKTNNVSLMCAKEHSIWHLGVAARYCQRNVVFFQGQIPTLHDGFPSSRSSCVEEPWVVYFDELFLCLWPSFSFLNADLFSYFRLKGNGYIMWYNIHLNQSAPSYRQRCSFEVKADKESHSSLARNLLRLPLTWRFLIYMVRLDRLSGESSIMYAGTCKTSNSNTLCGRYWRLTCRTCSDGNSVECKHEPPSSELIRLPEKFQKQFRSY